MLWLHFLWKYYTFHTIFISLVIYFKLDLYVLKLLSKYFSSYNAFFGLWSQVVIKNSQHVLQNVNKHCFIQGVFFFFSPLLVFPFCIVYVEGYIFTVYVLPLVRTSDLLFITDYLAKRHPDLCMQWFPPLLHKGVCNSTVRSQNLLRIMF